MALPIGAILSGLGAAGSIFGGALGGSNTPRETASQKRNRKLIDQLLSSLQGQGPFSDLFETDEDAFQRSFVEPSLQRFRDQIAPNIQQSFIQQGLQRGTGLENALTQAGVDLSSNLDALFSDFSNQGKQNQLSTLSAILGLGEQGAKPQQSFSSRLGQSAGGFLSSNAFSDLLKQIPRTGFEK